MTSVPLTERAIRSYMGTGGHNRCQDISSIHIQHDVDTAVAHVEARIPASSTRQGSYEVQVNVRSNGTHILGSSCTCPVGYKCKHTAKVLRRIATQAPIPGPSRRRREQEARRRQLARQMERASVYIALYCKSELDSGSDYRRSRYVKDNFDQQILGVFFSKAQANRCAKDYCRDELGIDSDDDDDDDDDDEMEDDDDDTFVFDGSDAGDLDEENAFPKVWVERRPIEDASPRFHT